MAHVYQGLSSTQPRLPQHPTALAAMTANTVVVRGKKIIKLVKLSVPLILGITWNSTRGKKKFFCFFLIAFSNWFTAIYKNIVLRKICKRATYNVQDENELVWKGSVSSSLCIFLEVVKKTDCGVTAAKVSEGRIKRWRWITRERTLYLYAGIYRLKRQCICTTK